MRTSRARATPELGVLEWFEIGEHDRVERAAAGLGERAGLDELHDRLVRLGKTQALGGASG